MPLIPRKISYLVYFYQCYRLFQVISPPPEFYPDFGALTKPTEEANNRSKWLSKQNLDFAFLMMYAQSRGTFYVQLEDDVISKPGFLSTMKTAATNKDAM